jgi:succinate-semialdehyde dehydrogenase/glutarate-semialdehyde dehydrogenase
MSVEVTDPATGERVEEYEQASDAEVAAALERAEGAFEGWRERSVPEREELIAAAADVLRANKREYAETMTREMGKPIAQAVGEVEKCAWVCDHYAEHAGAYLGADHHPSPPGTAVETVHDPLGPVLAVMPWNFPFWQVFRFAAPYLTAGNVGLLKHAPNVPGCARAIEEVFTEAGYPEGVFQSVLAPTDAVHDMVADDRVRAATLTGSSRAGRAVAETAGRHLKKTVLELGGSDPFVVLDDADVEAAAETGAWARTLNGGQSCIAAKRFVVHTDVYDAFVDALVAEVEALTVGDPREEATDVGPQAREDLFETLVGQVEGSVAAGATVLTGGEPLDSEGLFYPPTVLADVPEGCPAAEEEVFGPVAAVFEVAGEREAVELANDTDYGLGCSIWTADLDRGRRVARQVEAGCTYVNQLTKSDPRVPFGGVKGSGYGRELAGDGIREFVNRKTLWVESGGDG